MTITYILPKISSENLNENTNENTNEKPNVKCIDSTNKEKNTEKLLDNLEKSIEKLNQSLHKIIDILKINSNIRVIINDNYLNSKDVIALLKQYCEDEKLEKAFDYFEKSEKCFDIVKMKKEWNNISKT